MSTTSTGFTIHDLETVPYAARPALEQQAKAFGTVLSLHGILAESAPALETYNAAYAAFAQSSFTPAEQQFIYLAINRVNECEYCMAGHSVLAKNEGVDADTIEALREGTEIPDARQAALRDFVTAVVDQKGHVPLQQVQAFLDAGFTRQNVLDVVLAVATKVISSYTNHLSATPNEAFMKNTVWTAPSRRIEAA